MPVIVSIALATICFTFQGVEECHPVLLGKNSATPIGEYTLTGKRVDRPGYGGDILQFLETENEIYAIHRVWLLSPKQRRMERLKGNIIKDRFITNGCINVEPSVYDKLMECCVDDKLIVR